MNRRDLLKGGAAAAVATATTASSFPAPAIAQGVRTLKMVTSWPKGYPGLGTAAERFARRIEEGSGGRFKIQVYAGGELVHPLKCHDALQEGTAELYHSADYYYKGKAEAYAFFTTVPFGFTAAEMNAWLHHGGGQALWDEVGAQFGIKHLPCGNTGVQMGGWFKQEIKSLEDIKGLKMRIPGFGGDLWTAMGGTAVTLAGAEIMPALQAGTIDAADWVGPWNDLAFGFYKVVKNYYWPTFHEPGPALSAGISRKLWDSLSSSDQALFTAAALAENDYGLAEFNAHNQAALEALVNEHGVQLRQFSDEIYRGFGEAARDVVAKAGQSDELSKRVYESYSSFRRTIIRWSQIADQGFMNQRALVDFG